MPNTFEELLSELTHVQPSLEQKQQMCGDTKTTAANLIRLTQEALKIAALFPPDTRVEDINWSQIRVQKADFLRLFRGLKVTREDGTTSRDHRVYWRWIEIHSHEWDFKERRDDTISRLVIAGGDKTYRTAPSAHNGLAYLETA